MKSLKIALLRLAKKVGIFALMRWRNAKAVRILCYHGTMMTPRFPEDAMFFAPETFERRMESLLGLGYRIISLNEAVEGLAGRAPLPDNAAVITIDDGWYSTYREMWPVLARHRLAATLYVDTGNIGGVRVLANCLSDYMRHEVDVESLGAEETSLFATAANRDVPPHERFAAMRLLAARVGYEIDSLIASRAFDYMTVDELRAVANAGLAIELHTHNHTIGDHGAAIVASEVKANRTALAALLDRPPESFRHFCYPSGDCSPAAASALRQSSIVSATTTELGLARPTDDLMLLPRLLDNPSWSDIEFEAELCGVGQLMREARRRLEATVTRFCLPSRPSERPAA